MSKLTDKIIVITGGGQGLGESITRTLADTGAHVFPVDIQEEQVNKVAKDLQKQGKKANAMVLNVTDEKNIQEVIHAIDKNHGKIDVLINNAGIDVTKPIEDMTIEEFDRVIRINLRGVFIMSKIVLPIMIKQKKGYIVNIASTAAKRAWPNASAYHASKWGILGLSYAMYTELREKNIKVTVVLPGGMRTPFILERFPDTPLNKLQDPKNVAETVKFILQQPDETIIPEVMVIPLHESSWP